MKTNRIFKGLCTAGLCGNVLISPLQAQAVKLSDAQSAILQADGPRAQQLFERVLNSQNSLSLWDRRRVVCSIARLSGTASIPLPAFSGDQFADRTIEIYRAYWQQAIAPGQRESAEVWLFDELRKVIDRPNLTDRDTVLAELSKQLNARNIYVTLGKTASLYDLLLYLNEEEEKSYKVDLIDGTSHDVTVFLMRSMVSYGWSRYFNCGGPGTGGFATDKGLYAIAEVYDLDSEDFMINFLSHETRHYADYKRYPGLEGPELEYRAKLTELALADKTLSQTLKRFERDQGDDRAIPHSFANKHVLAALRERLGIGADADVSSINPVTLRQAARDLLMADNAIRSAKP
jgi:hypothetical protein